MARYVVLEFADNKEAEDFVDAFQKKQVTYTKPGDSIPVEGERDIPTYKVLYPEKPSAVVGYYMRPTQTCDCPPPPKNTKRGLSQGAKFGLWVHQCGKILPIAMEAWGHAPGLGRNLLVDNERLKELNQDGKLVEGLLRLNGDVPRMAIRTPEDYVKLGKPGYQGGGR